MEPRDKLRPIILLASIIGFKFGDLSEFIGVGTETIMILVVFNIV